jgi:hypothetical protein
LRLTSAHNGHQPNVQIKCFRCDWSICIQLRQIRCGNMIHSNDVILICLFDIQSSWSKTRFETWITRSDVNDVNLFLFFYLITLMLYLCSHCLPNVQIVFFIFDWSIYRLFLLNRAWNLEKIQMIIFAHVCSTCSVVELKTRFEKWISRNVVNGVNLFLFSCLITLTTYDTKWRKLCTFPSHFLFNNTYGLPGLTMGPKCSNQVFYVWLVGLQTTCAK